jgi:hypothetical protein
MSRLDHKLALTETQKKSIMPLLIGAYRQGHERFIETRQQMDTIFKNTLTQIKQHLNEQQVDKLDTEQSFRILIPGPGPRRGPGPGPGRGPGPGPPPGPRPEPGRGPGPGPHN